MTQAAAGTADLSLPASGTGTGTGAADTANAGATGSAGGAGTPAPFDWKTAGLAPGHLALVTERGWKSPDDLMTSFRHLEGATGVPPERLIKLPGAKDAADPKVWNDIYTKLGRPETADQYNIPVPQGEKGEFAAEIKPVLHKIGLTQSQATELGTWWNEKVVATQKAQQAELEATHAKEVGELKSAWGADYDQRAGLVDKAAESFGMNQEQLDALKVVMGPKGAMNFLYNIGSKIAVEDKTVPGMSGQKTNVGMTPEVAAARLAEMKKDKTFAQQFSSSDPKQRAEARAEVDRLSRLAYPGETSIPMASTGRSR